MQARTESPVFKAIREGNLEELQKFLDCGIDMTNHGAKELSPLSYACDINAWACVEVIAKNSKPNENNFISYQRAISNAVFANQYEAVKALIEACEMNDLYLRRDFYSWRGQFAPHWAVIHRNIPMIKLLIGHLGKFDDTNKDNMTPMQLAASIGAYECVDAIASLSNTFNDDIYKYGDALLVAVHDGQLKSVEKLLDSKAPLNCVTKKEQNSALHCAVINNDVPMLKLLIEKGASLDAKNIYGKTPFQSACDLGYFDCAELCYADKYAYTDVDGARYGALVIYAIDSEDVDLLERLHQAGASLTARTRADGKTALHHAADRYSADCVALLLKYGANQHAVAQYDYTPIHEAADKKAWRVVKAMLDVYQDKKLSLPEMEALHLVSVLGAAIRDNQIEMVKFLLGLGVPCDKTSPGLGNIVLSDAVIFCEKNPDIVTLLLEHGADPNVRNHNGKTTHDIARGLKSTKCAQRLTNFDSGMSAESVNDLTISINAIFEELYTPMMVPKLIYIHIAAYQVLQFELLNNDLKALRAKRNFMQLHPETAKREIAALDRQIAVIQQLLNYPNSRPAPASGFENTPSSTHIHDFVDHSQKIHDYAERVKEFLRSIKETINQKNREQSWKVKSFLDVFTNKYSFGIPDHVKKIMIELKKYMDKPSDLGAVICFTNITFIFAGLEHNWLRHLETTEFIKDQMTKIENLHFMPPQGRVQRLESSPRM